MLHQRRACARVRSRKNSVQGDFSHDFTRERSSEVRKFAIAWAIGKSREPGVRQRRRVRHSSPDVTDRSAPSTDLATIAPYASSRSSILFKGSSSCSECLVREWLLCARTKLRNHSLRTRACAATASSSPGRQLARIVAAASGGTSSACSSQVIRSFPSASHSTTLSTDVPIELRKSRLGSPAMNIAGGRESLVAISARCCS